ncbi:MAG: aldo/keto reductase [Candidatus Omnitrophica bacterium]|nr:aldo/keto reductase [Candidatus Omnitrophota bacterium]
MRYREFGNTPYYVSMLGFGAMRLPHLPDGTVDFDRSTQLIKYAIEHGVNFIDSHHFYHNGQSEQAIGMAIKGFPREKLIIQTKIGMYNNYTDDQCWKLLETALKKLGTDYIDFYLTHSLRWETYLQHNRQFMNFTQKALDQKLIRYTGFSVHDSLENIKKIISTGEFSTMTVQYNILYRESEEAIALAHEKGMGVVVMGPVGGGTFGNPAEELTQWLEKKIESTASLALRFVLSNPNVSVAISGMNAIEQVIENIETVSNFVPLDSDDIKKLDAIIETRKKLLNLYCTGCKYCMPCQHGVNIPGNFNWYNVANVYGVKKRSEEKYFSMKPEERASSCAQCGECESKCPQKIPIREKLKEVSDYFEKK